MIKVLLLGVGRWGSNHLRVLNSLPVELLVSDIHKERLSAALTIGIPATHLSTNPRFAGQSHYGVWNRLFKSLTGLLAIRRMMKQRIHYEIIEKLNLS